MVWPFVTSGTTSELNRYVMVQTLILNVTLKLFPATKLMAGTPSHFQRCFSLAFNCSEEITFLVKLNICLLTEDTGLNTVVYSIIYISRRDMENRKIIKVFYLKYRNKIVEYKQFNTLTCFCKNCNSDPNPTLENARLNMEELTVLISHITTDTLRRQGAQLQNKDFHYVLFYSTVILPLRFPISSSTSVFLLLFLLDRVCEQPQAILIVDVSISCLSKDDTASGC
uniref:Uncharacterized protein n=1 Tax=Glossina pallidipes TaxID=7398 RepID=A0A1A9ZG48_GLOPL